VTPEDRFEQIAAGVEGEPGVTRGTIFGSPGIKAGGKVFACLVKGRLVLKLPEERVNALAEAGTGEHFDPGMGRVMREWVALEPASAEEWPALAAEARRYVVSLSAG
jgi:hypothetical protein